MNGVAIRTAAHVSLLQTDWIPSGATQVWNSFATDSSFQFFEELDTDFLGGFSH